jgi:hypothetical protein
MLSATIADFIKASGKRGLVKKKVQVTRGGRTFMQTVWVSPWEKDRPKFGPKEAKPKPLLFDDEIQTIRDMLEKEFNPELIANKLEREREDMGEQPVPRKSLVHAIEQVEKDIKKETPWHGTGRRWSSVLAEKWLGKPKAEAKAEPKKEADHEPVEDPTSKENLVRAAEKVENLQIKISGLFARVHQLQTMLAMLQQRAESAKRVPKVAAKDKPVPSKPREQGAPRSSVRKARTLMSDIQAQLNTVEAELKSLGLQNLAKDFPELSKQINATITSVEAIKTNLRNAGDSIKGLEKTTSVEVAKEVAEPEKPAEKVIDEAKKPLSAKDLAEAHKARAAERAKTLEAIRAKKEAPKVEPKVEEEPSRYEKERIREREMTLKRVEAAAAARTTAATIGSEKAATTKTPEELKAQAKKRADELAKKIASAKPFLKKKRVEAPKKEETPKGVWVSGLRGFGYLRV